jgi:hypothetical protein
MKWAEIKRMWRSDDMVPTTNPYVQKMVVQPYTQLASKVRSAVVLKPHALINIKVMSWLWCKDWSRPAPYSFIQGYVTFEVLTVVTEDYSFLCCNTL